MKGFQEDDDGGLAAYRLIKTVDDWDAYLRTPYARRTFYDALKTVISNREHGNIKECFDIMLRNIDDIVIDSDRPAVRGTCDLCKRKRQLSYFLSTPNKGSNCGTLMGAIYELMLGVWHGDDTDTIQENLDAVIEANKEYKS